MKDTLSKLEDLNRQRKEIIDRLQDEFNDALKQVFVDNPKLESIDMYVNNHEFNDGDATSFYIGWEDMTITVDGVEIFKSRKELISKLGWGDSGIRNKQFRYL